MQRENKAWWSDARIFKSKDVPWRINCKRMVAHVCVFCFDCESWFWSCGILDRIKGWEIKIMRSFRFTRIDKEMWSGYCMRTARAARSNLEEDEVALSL